MTIYAVMKIGGKEHRVAPGDVVRVEKLAAAPGATVEIHEVCLIATGQDVTVGSPTVADARVVAEVIEEGRGEKIFVFKKKRNRYQMTTGDLQSYTVLRIREIALGNNVYAAATPPPPSPPRISKPERKIPQPQAKKPLQPPTLPPLVPIELPPQIAAPGDAPVAPQAPQPSSDAVHPVHAVESPPSAPSTTEAPPARVAPPLRVETAAPVPALDERGPRKHSSRIAALVVALLVIAAGVLVWSSRRPPGLVEAATVAAVPQAATPSVPETPAKAPPRMETAIRKPVAASAPSAPVQPPE